MSSLKNRDPHRLGILKDPWYLQWFYRGKPMHNSGVNMAFHCQDRLHLEEIEKCFFPNL